MSTFEYLFAFALLASPPETLELSDPVQLHGPLAPTLQALALHLELLDAREKHILAKPDEFARDLKDLQERFQELAGAPSLADSHRFPNREIAGDLLAFNRAYRDSLSNRLALDAVHAEELRAALTETDTLYQIWDAVQNTRCEAYYIVFRRRCLQELRQLVGAQAFYSGQLPPHVPLWRIPIAE